MSQHVNNSQFSLSENEVQIWLLDIRQFQSYLSKLSAWLDHVEHERADRYVFAVDKVRFTVARASLRYLLSCYTQQQPAAIEFNSHSHGKPFLAGALLGSLEFNVSHSHDFVIVAVTKRLSVGVDIEYHRQGIEFEAIATRYFTKKEYEWWKQLPVTEMTAGFFKLWSCKEAIVKGLGLGLSYPSTSFDVLQATRIIQLTEKKNNLPLEWYLEDFTPESGYSAAVAVATNAHPLIHWYQLTPAEMF